MGDAALAGRLVSLTASIGLIVVIYLLTRRLYGSNAAIFAALMAALYPHLLEFSVRPYSETLYALLISTAVLILLGLVLTMERRRPVARRGLAAGVVLRLSYLTRPEGVVFIAVSAGLIWIMSVRKDRSIRSLVSAAAIVGGAALLVIPYMVFLHEHLGRWTISGKEGAAIGWAIAVGRGQNPEEFLFSLTGDGTRVVAETEYARQRPSLPQIVRAYTDNLYHEQAILVEVMPLPLLVVAFLGLIQKPLNSARWSMRIILAVFAAVYLLLYPALYVFARLLVPLVGILIPMLARGTIDLETRYDNPPCGTGPRPFMSRIGRWS
jgi:4-amino-4-deoxy-L-arabinose transferase-like glycosyltransferase